LDKGLILIAALILCGSPIKPFFVAEIIRVNLEMSEGSVV